MVNEFSVAIGRILGLAAGTLQDAFIQPAAGRGGCVPISGGHAGGPCLFT